MLCPVTTNLSPSVSFVCSSLLKGNAFYYIIRFPTIHISSCSSNVRVLQVKRSMSALQMSPQLSLLVNFHSIANFQLLGFPWNMLKWEKRTMLQLMSICTSWLRLFLFLHLYQDTCNDFKRALIRTSGFSCSVLWRKYTYYRSWRYLCLIFKGEFFSPLNNCNKIFVWRYWCKERKSWPDSSFQWHFKIQFLIRDVMLMERTWVWGTQSVNTIYWYHCSLICPWIDLNFSLIEFSHL